MVDRKLAVLYSTSTLICMVYGLMNPFLPLLARDKGLSSQEVGIIFSAFPLAGIVTTPCIGAFLFRVGRRTTLLLAFLSMSVGFSASAGSVWMQREGFFAVNVVARALSGLACALMFTTVISVIASDYPTKVFEYVGLNESMVGLGYLIGPIVGSGLYVLFGIFGTFLFSAGFYAVGGVVVFCLLGPDREYRLADKDEHILWLGTRPRIFATNLPIFFGMAVMSAQYMFISPHLEDNGLSRPYIALAFVLTGVGYVGISFLFAKTIEHWDKRVVNSVGCALCALSMALVGPWPWLVPENAATILVGFALEPVGLGMLFVEVMPSLIEVATSDLGMENDDKLLDKLSGIRDSCGIFAGFGLVIIGAYFGVFAFCSSRKVENSDAAEPINRK